MINDVTKNGLNTAPTPYNPCNSPNTSLAFAMFPIQAFHAESASPLPNPAKIKDTTSTGYVGCKQLVIYETRWHPGAMTATPRWPRDRWILLLRMAAREYPAKGERKTRETTV